MKVREEKTPITDDLRNSLARIDFTDTFSTTNHINSLEEITHLVFNKAPKWVDVLFKLRNKAAALVGLKTTIPEDYNENFTIGGYVAFFKIFAISDNQVILGVDDTHLNFRAVIKKMESDTYNIKVITIVEFNNRMGKIYMGIIKPFHRIVVKRMVKNAYRSVAENS